MTQSIYATIATKIDIQGFCVLLRRMHILVSNNFGVPKVPKTNSQGPKVMWVPKVNV